MKVNLIAVSKPTDYTACRNSEDLIAWCARVSNLKNRNNTDTAPKLVKYLINNAHWSPLEMVSATMEIVTTRDIAKQIIRHRSFSFQEFSQRYADVTEDLEFQYREARLQDKKNRQNSLECNDAVLEINFKQKQREVIEAANRAYQWALSNGIAKEQARAVLPEGLTPSVVIMAGTLRSWIHYVDLRTDPATQKEHREVAQACKNVLIDEFPSIAEALNWSKD